MKLHPLLFAPIVLCAPALAQEAPLYFDQLLADLKSSPESFQTYFHGWILDATAFYQNMPHIDESTPFEADKQFVLLTSTQDLMMTQKGLQSAYSPEFKAYQQELIELNEKTIELCRSSCSEADFYEQLSNLLTQAEQINEKEAYTSIRKELNVKKDLRHIAECLALIKEIKQIVTQREKSSTYKRLQQSAIDSLKTLSKLIDGRMDIKRDEFPFNITSTEELKRCTTQLTRISMYEANFIDSSDDIKPSSFAHQFKLCSFEQKALLFSYLAAQCRAAAEYLLCRNNPDFKPEECAKEFLMPLYPADGVHAAYWARYVELYSLKDAKTTTVDVKGELAKLKEQDPEAAAYFAPLEQGQAPAFLTTFLKQDEIMERCQNKMENLQKQLKENPEQAAEFIHYGCQIVYAQALAEMFDEFAALYRILAK